MQSWKIAIIALSVTTLAGCSSFGDAGDKLSSGFANVKDSVSKRVDKTKNSVSKRTAIVTGGLVGEDEYEKAVAKARRRYKKMPADQICWQARQEIAQSWELYKANKRFIRKNSIGKTGNKLWSAFTNNLYKTVDNAIPLPFPDLPDDRLSYAAKQITFNRKNIEEWSVIYDSLCKK